MKLRGLLWWVDRWRRSSAYTGMTLEEQGAYRNLLDEAFLRGGAIPDDQGVLSRACGDASVWPRVMPAVMRHFTLFNDGWHNATLDQVRSRASKRAARQRKFRNKNADSVTDGVTDGVTTGVTESVTEGVTRWRSGSGSDLSTEKRSEPVSRSRASLVQPRRANAAFEGHRLYVPQQLHAEFVRLRNHPEAEKELFAWYETVCEEWTVGAHRDTPVGGDMFSFWRQRLSEKWPLPATAVSRRRPAWAVEES